MGQVDVDIVTSWYGISQSGEITRSERKGLDRPREIVNFWLDDNGHLFMPKAVDTSIGFTGGKSILAIRYIGSPSGIVVQTEEKIWFVPEGSATPIEVAVPTYKNWRIWALTGDGASYVGYARRGTSSGGQTFKIVDDGSGGITVTEPADQPEASFSTFYKGRRFVMNRGRIVKYSELNDHENFPDDNEFEIAGDDGGNTYGDSPGYVKGMVGWEDVLMLFLTGSTWQLTGAGPNSWRVSEIQTTIGNTSEWTLTPSEKGVLTYAGTNQQYDNFFIFTGNSVQNISESLKELVAPWVSGTDDIDREPRLSADYQYGRFIVALGNEEADDLQLLVWNLNTGQWTSFDGFRRSAIASSPEGVYYTNVTGDDAELSVQYAPRTVARFPGRNATVKMGWSDKGHSAGLIRVLAIKIAGKKTGTGNPTVTATVKVPDTGAEITSAAIDITEDIFDGIVIPVNLRGNAVEIELSIDPSNNDNTVLLESLQVITSRKGEKVSRA